MIGQIRLIRAPGKHSIVLPTHPLGSENRRFFRVKHNSYFLVTKVLSTGYFGYLLAERRFFHCSHQLFYGATVAVVNGE